MCFSASASFIAGTSLSAVGVAALRNTKARSEQPLAAIPLLFGIQQLTEGVICDGALPCGDVCQLLFLESRVRKAVWRVSLLSFVAAYIVHVGALVSIWCFFAAILSLLIYLHLRFRARGGFPAEPLFPPAFARSAGMGQD